MDKADQVTKSPTLRGVGIGEEVDLPTYLRPSQAPKLNVYNAIQCFSLQRALELLEVLAEDDY